MAEVSPYWAKVSGGSAAQSNVSVDQDSGRERVKLLESLPEHAETFTPANDDVRNQPSSGNELYHEDEEYSVLSHVYMSVYRQGGDSQSREYGVSYYDANTDVIYVGQLHDIDRRALSSLKAVLVPRVILTNVASMDPLHASLSENVYATEINPAAPFNVMTLKRSDFSYEGAKNRLQLIRIQELINQNGGSSRELTEIERSLQLMSVIQFEQQQMVCSCGGLLSYLDKNRILNQLSDDDVPVTITAIRNLESLANSMVVDAGTRRCLSIFQKEVHPAGDTGPRKEALSVYAVLKRTQTSIGAKLLRHWISSPTMDRSVIEARHRDIEEMLAPANQALVEELSIHLQGVTDLNRVVSKIRNVRATYSDWVTLKTGIEQLIALRELECKQCEQFSLSFLSNIVSIWDESITELNRLLSSTIDFELSQQERRISILDGVFPQLDRQRKLLQELPDILTEETIQLEEMVSNEALSSHMCVNYFPQIGYVIGVNSKLLDVAANGVNVVPDDWRFHFEDSDKSQKFFKSSRMEELDKTALIDEGVIHDMEMSILRELEPHVLLLQSSLSAMTAFAAELDCRLSLAKSALDLGLVRPEMTDESTLQIVNGFHLMQQSYCVDNFIPNPTHIGSSVDSGGVIHILSGPNSSGKSVYLKQVGIIVYLAHCGSFVPAESALIGVTDRILSRMDSAESANGFLSTFMRDCSQLAFLQKHATFQSLVLVDEFGKGTCREDGIALLCSFIRHWVRKPLHECPNLIVTTHLCEMFQDSLLLPSQGLCFKQMQIVKKTDKDEKEELVFLYRIVDGVTEQSYGIECAARTNMNKEQLDRAHQIAFHLKNKLPIDPVGMESEQSTRHKTLFDMFFAIDFDDGSQVDTLFQLIQQG